MVKSGKMMQKEWKAQFEHLGIFIAKVFASVPMLLDHMFTKHY